MPRKKQNQASKALTVRNAPVSKSVRANYTRPNIQQKPDGTVRIRHREFLSDFTAISTDAEFNVWRTTINPATEATFPWLSGVALNYELFRFRKIKFSVVPLLPTSAPGWVATAIDYDVDDVAPATKNALYAMDGVQRSAIWDRCETVSDARALHPTGEFKFVDSAVLDRLSTCGHALFACGGFDMNAGGSLAEMWVEYDVELSVPQLRPNLSATKLSLDIWCDSATKSNPFNGASVEGSLNVVLKNAAANLARYVMARAGNYVMQTYLTGTGLTTPTSSGKNIVSTLLNTSGTSTDAVYTYLIEVIANSTWLADGISTTPTSSLEGAYYTQDFSASTTLTSLHSLISPYLRASYVLENRVLYYETEDGYKCYILKSVPTHRYPPVPVGAKVHLVSGATPFQ